MRDQEPSSPCDRPDAPEAAPRAPGDCASAPAAGGSIDQPTIRLGHWVWVPGRDPSDPSAGRSRYSRAAAEIFGVEPSELAVDDRTFCKRFVHPEDRDRLLAALRRGLQPGQAGYRVEYRIIRADGEMRTVQDVAEKVLAETGALAQIVGSVQDITELRRVEQALRDSEQRFRTLLDSAPVLLWMADETGAITYVSKPWCVYTGLEEADGLGFNWLKTVHPDDLPRIRAIEAEAFNERRPYSMDYRVRGADGIYRWFVDRGAPRFAPDGTFLGTAGCVFEISDRRQLESELKLSQARLMALADNSPMTISLKDLDGRYLMANRAFEKSYGMSGDQVRGKTPFDVFSPEDAEAFVTHDRAAMDGGAAIRRDFTYDGPRGQRCLSVTKFPVFDAEGGLIGVGGIEVDVTDSRRAEAVIRESEQRFRTIADTIPALIWMSDRKGDCIFVNKTWLDYTGRTLDCELGRGFVDSIHPEDRSSTADSEGELFSKREILSIDYRLRGADQQYRWFLDTAAPRLSPEGEYLGYIGILVDITERRRLETELKLAKDQAETANRTKTQFLANMSHELRTPLNAIIGFSEIIMKQMFGQVSSQHYLDYAADINQSGRHLLDVINDILDLSKIEAGKLELHEEDCDVAEILRSATRVVRDSARSNHLSLVEEVDPDLPPLFADGRAVKQIVLNLLSNAVKFTPEGGTVTISAGIAEGGLVVGVTDTGIGIAPDDLPRAFEAFGQIDSSLSRKFEGTGLGLPLTKALTEMHGARLGLESQPGVGTRATVAFPAGRTGRRQSATAAAGS